jgi:hypothetical protein
MAMISNWAPQERFAELRAMVRVHPGTSVLLSGFQAISRASAADVPVTGKSISTP